MSNTKQSSVEWLVEKLSKYDEEMLFLYQEEIAEAKEMQQEQAQLYASFVLKCVQNNLPPITFNDWINLENNEQQ